MEFFFLTFFYNESNKSTLTFTKMKSMQNLVYFISLPMFCTFHYFFVLYVAKIY